MLQDFGDIALLAFDPENVAANRPEKPIRTNSADFAAHGPISNNEHQHSHETQLRSRKHWPLNKNTFPFLNQSICLFVERIVNASYQFLALGADI